MQKNLATYTQTLTFGLQLHNWKPILHMICMLKISRKLLKNSYKNLQNLQVMKPSVHPSVHISIHPSIHLTFSLRICQASFVSCFRANSLQSEFDFPMMSRIYFPTPLIQDDCQSGQKILIFISLNPSGCRNFEHELSDSHCLQNTDIIYKKL